MKLIAVLAMITILSVGSVYAAEQVFDDNIQLPNGKAIKFEDHAGSVARTDTTGTTSGNFLNLRGFDGLVMRTGGTGAFGTGDEQLRIGPAGVETLKMSSGKSVKFVEDAVSVARTDTTGTTSGNFLNLRGFDGIVMRTGGTADFGTGDEQIRLTSTGLGIGTNPTQKLDVNGNINLNGNITSSGDICIGACGP